MRKLVLNILAGVLLTAVFTACGGGGSSTITMTTESKNVGFRLYGSGTATVNWGDGSERVTQTLTESGVWFRHNYSSITIRTIRISGNNITGLSCRYNVNMNVFMSLTYLDVRRATALTNLDVSGHQLTNLDVSRNTALTNLDLSFNRLTDLDVSRNTALTSLNVYGNGLRNLDLSKNTALASLNVRGGNPISTDAMNALFRTLHSNDVGRHKSIGISRRQGVDISIAERKGWRVWW